MLAELPRGWGRGGRFPEIRPFILRLTARSPRSSEVEEVTVQAMGMEALEAALQVAKDATPSHVTPKPADEKWDREPIVGMAS